MRAVQFDYSLARYLLLKSIGRLEPSLFWGPFSSIRYREVPQPALPTQEWVKIRVLYSGICGSDLNLIFLRESLSLSPFASFPFTIGHEIVGVVEEAGNLVEGLAKGDRVVVEPILSCTARGFKACCPACQQGDFNLCERMTDGNISPGLIIGTCRDTGGGWSSHFVAHQSQVFKLPAKVNDLNAVLVDPFATALHGVLQDPPQNGNTVLVIGAGVIGICVVAAIRALGIAAKVTVLAKYPFQLKMAQRFGANDLIQVSEGWGYYEDAAQLFGAKVRNPFSGKPVLQGGADMVYECVGQDQSIDDALRFTKSGGKVVLLGVASVPRQVDWTPIWLNELQVKGRFACSTEELSGERQHTYAIALELLSRGKVDLSPLITHRFRLDQYRQAIAAATGKGKSQALKVVLFPEP